MDHVVFCDLVTNFLIVYGALSFARTLAKFWR
mgnify:CR=1 FL=1